MADFGQRWGGKGSRAPFVIKKREREQHEIAIAGGFKRAGGRRRITKWSKWTPIRHVQDEHSALIHLEHAAKLHPLSEVACFYRGKRIGTDQLAFRIKESERLREDIEDSARAEREAEALTIGTPDCAHCARRQRAGLEGQCPQCANERVRRELAQERGRSSC